MDTPDLDLDEEVPVVELTSSRRTRPHKKAASSSSLEEPRFLQAGRKAKTFSAGDKLYSSRPRSDTPSTLKALHRKSVTKGYTKHHDSNPRGFENSYFSQVNRSVAPEIPDDDTIIDASHSRYKDDPMYELMARKASDYISPPTITGNIFKTAPLLDTQSRLADYQIRKRGWGSIAQESVNPGNDSSQSTTNWDSFRNFWSSPATYISSISIGILTVQAKDIIEVYLRSGIQALISFVSILTITCSIVGVVLLIWKYILRDSVVKDIKHEVEVTSPHLYSPLSPNMADPRLSVVSSTNGSATSLDTSYRSMGSSYSSLGDSQKHPHMYLSRANTSQLKERPVFAERSISNPVFSSSSASTQPAFGSHSWSHLKHPSSYGDREGLDTMYNEESLSPRAKQPLGDQHQLRELEEEDEIQFHSSSTEDDIYEFGDDEFGDNKGGNVHQQNDKLASRDSTVSITSLDSDPYDYMDKQVDKKLSNAAFKTTPSRSLSDPKLSPSKMQILFHRQEPEQQAYLDKHSCKPYGPPPRRYHGVNV